MQKKHYRHISGPRSQATAAAPEGAQLEHEGMDRTTSNLVMVKVDDRIKRKTLQGYLIGNPNQPHAKQIVETLYICRKSWLCVMNLMARGRNGYNVLNFVLIDSNFNSKCQAHISCFHFDIFLSSFLILKQHDSKENSSSNSQHLTTSSNGSNAQRGSEASSKKKKSYKKKKRKLHRKLCEQHIDLGG